MTIARLTWVRLLRGRTIYMSGLLMVLVPAIAGLFDALGEQSGWQAAVGFALHLWISLAVGVHLASAVGEEIESKTYTYLWSRPVPRTSLVLGKAVAIVAVMVAGFAVAFLLAHAITGGESSVPLGPALAAMVASVLASAALSLGAGALFPRRPLAFVLAYLLVLDQIAGFVPMLKTISISYQASVLGGIEREGGTGDAVVALAALTAVWLGVALWRVGSAEYASVDQ